MAPQAGRPRLQPVRLDLGELGRSGDLLGHAGQQHAPTGAGEDVPPVDLEGDHLSVHRGGQELPGSRAHDDRVTNDDEVHGEDDRRTARADGDPSDRRGA